MRRTELCSRVHVDTVNRHLASPEASGDLLVQALEDGEYVYLTRRQLRCISSLCRDRCAQSLTLLQGQDGTVYILLDAAGGIGRRRIWLLDDFS